MKDISNRWKVIAVIFTVAFVMTMYLGAKMIKEAQSNGRLKETPMSAQSDTSADEPAVACVVLDPGHGGFDGGAVGNKTGVVEAQINLAISFLVRTKLENENVKVILTRESDTALADNKKDDMKRRRKIMHESNADITLSIHMNKFKDTSIHGPMVFYTEGDTASEKLAEFVLQSVCEMTNFPKRLTNMGDYYVIRDSEIPAVIVECGFLSNSTDEINLCDIDFQDKLASGIADGILTYIRESDNASSY